jgi:hypothetical protein
LIKWLAARYHHPLILELSEYLFNRHVGAFEYHEFFIETELAVIHAALHIDSVAKVDNICRC